ncbi:PREDICTED: perivitellin-2 67 kDa subunit-like, partial [Rhagoletis zephyria]|uniref:perivitellin-2 67 kDa subunit-like n=1 Tax=Rhagoletis zephyria TaxID=28612 RepID=UPI00081126C3
DPDGDGDRDEDDKVCGELVVPGIDRISRGIDITELDLTPPETARTVIGGVRSRLIDFTCNREEKWQHPQTEVTYDVPDQVQRPATLPTGSLKAVVKISGDSEELKKSWSTKVGAGLEDVEKFGFSASVTFKGVQESLHQNNKTMAETTAAVSTHMVDFKLPRHLKLTDDFSQFFDDDGDGDKAAVAKYEENPRLYDKFVRQFGTHYFESATFGGSLYMKTQLVERYVSANSEDEIESNLEAKFLGKFNVNAETDHKRSNVSDSFESSSKTEIVYYGGWLPEGVTTDNPD